MKFTKKIFGSKFANKFVAEVMGKSAQHRPTAWESDGRSYSYIAGGVALPSMDYPGFLLTVGVRSSDNRFECIEEFESIGESQIIQRMIDIQAEYGHGVMQNWWGNTAALMPLVQQAGNASVIIAMPPNFEDKDAFQLYASQVRLALSREYKQLSIGDCTRLRSHLQGFRKDSSAKLGNNPAIAVAGWLCHTIMTYRPWEQALERTDLAPTMPGDFDIYADEQAMEETEKELWGAV